MTNRGEDGSTGGFPVTEVCDGQLDGALGKRAAARLSFFLEHRHARAHGGVAERAGR